MTMNAYKKKKRTFSAMGACSILMVFVVLCLTTFAILSFVSAQGDLRLTQKTQNMTERFYKADADTDGLLYFIDTILAGIRADMREADYDWRTDEALAAVDVPADMTDESAYLLISRFRITQRAGEVRGSLSVTGDDTLTLLMPITENQHIQTVLHLLPLGAPLRFEVQSRVRISTLDWE